VKQKWTILYISKPARKNVVTHFVIFFYALNKYKILIEEEGLWLCKLTTAFFFNFSGECVTHSHTGICGTPELGDEITHETYYISFYCRACRVTRCGETTAYVRGEIYHSINQPMITKIVEIAFHLSFIKICWFFYSLKTILQK
jgi:hypothetical protein